MPFQFAAIVGTPLAGAIYEATQSYDIPFYTAGKREKRNEKQKSNLTL
jgi:hypothetical protein